MQHVEHRFVKLAVALNPYARPFSTFLPALNVARTRLLRDAADDEARREVRRRRRRLFHDQPGRARAAVREAEANTVVGRRALDRVPETELQARDRPDLRERPADRP